MFLGVNEFARDKKLLLSAFVVRRKRGMSPIDHYKHGHLDCGGKMCKNYFFLNIINKGHISQQAMYLHSLN